MERRESANKRNKGTSPIVPVIIVVAIVAMVVTIVIKGRGSRGTCLHDNVYRKVTCMVKQLRHVPDDIPDGTLTLHMGTKLDKQENHFTSLGRVNLSRFSSLQELRMIKCGIEEIQPQAFSDLTGLRRLDLRYNRIQMITQQTFQGLTSLEYLYLSNNPITGLVESNFRGMRIEHLVFANNPALSDISEKAFAGSIIKTLVINRCNIKTIAPETFSYVKESLQELYITHNMQPLDLPETVFGGLKLEKLTLANNGLEEADFLEHVTAEEITLDDNPLEEIDFDDSPLLKYTKRLSLSKTKIHRLGKENLSMLMNLQELDLDGNFLTILNATEFEHMDDLQVLDLSDNDLEDFDGDFENEFPSLESLYLDGNEIETLPERLKPLFGRLKNLTLHDNPLHCNCEIRWFAKWLEQEEHRAIIPELHSLKCDTPNSQNLTTISDYGFQCRPPTIFNATIDKDGMALVCVASGDPPPKVTWVTPVGDEFVTLPPRADRDSFQTINTLTLTKDGNYTCIAESIAGRESVQVDTRKMPSSSIKFHTHSQEIEILETPYGFTATVGLMAILGYIFRYQ